MTAKCVRCGAPTDATVCRPEASALAERLTAAAGHAEDANTVIARQARYGGGGRGGTIDKLPNLTTSAKLAHVAGVVSTWGQRILDQTDAPEPQPWRHMAGPLCPPRKPGHPPPGPGKGWRCQHDSCDAIRDRTPPSALADTLQWLAANIGHLRRHPAAADAFRELHTATHQLERLVDRPADNRHFIGICDCGKALYAPWDWTVIQCKERTCGAVWNLADGQDILLRHLDDKLVTVSESLRLAGHLDPERSQDAVRKLIEKWVSHSRLLAHGEVQREPTEAELRRDPDLSLVSVPTYRFGEIRTLLDETPRRERKTAA